MKKHFKTYWTGYVAALMLISMILFATFGESPIDRWHAFKECVKQAGGASDMNCDSCWKTIYGESETRF